MEHSIKILFFVLWVKRSHYLWICQKGPSDHDHQKKQANRNIQVLLRNLKAKGKSEL